jgi:pescadillo
VVTGSARKSVESQPVGLIEEKKERDENMDAGVNESELRLAQLQHHLPSNEPGTLMQLLEGSTNDDDDDDQDTTECKTLFKKLKFFLGREVCNLLL